MSQPTKELPKLGPKVRALRRRENLNQVQLAERLGISPSYLNLIENNRRPLPAAVLIKLAQAFRVELDTFATEGDARLVADLLEGFADPLFEADNLSSTEIREMSIASPQAARAVLRLFRAYQGAREAAENLSSRLSDDEELAGTTLSHLPSEQGSDSIHRPRNHFPELEAGGGGVRRAAQ